MSPASYQSPLEQLLDPLAAGFSPQMAQYVASFRADERVQARIEELADKANEDELTAAERDEYASYINAATMIAILQAKARDKLDAAL